MSKSNEYLEQSLRIISDYIKGNINLEQALIGLYELGHTKKSAKEVLFETKRNNIIQLSIPKIRKKNKLRKNYSANIIKLIPSSPRSLHGITESKNNFFIDGEVEDFIELNDDEVEFEIIYED